MSQQAMSMALMAENITVPPPCAQKVWVYIRSQTASVAMGSMPITSGATSWIMRYEALAPVSKPTDASP